jgi:hypothetical protein
MTNGTVQKSGGTTLVVNYQDGSETISTRCADAKSEAAVAASPPLPGPYPSALRELDLQPLQLSHGRVPHPCVFCEGGRRCCVFYLISLWTRDQIRLAHREKREAKGAHWFGNAPQDRPLGPNRQGKLFKMGKHPVTAVLDGVRNGLYVEFFVAGCRRLLQCRFASPDGHDQRPRVGGRRRSGVRHCHVQSAYIPDSAVHVEFGPAGASNCVRRPRYRHYSPGRLSPFGRANGPPAVAGHCDRHNGSDRNDPFGAGRQRRLRRGNTTDHRPGLDTMALGSAHRMAIHPSCSGVAAAHCHARDGNVVADRHRSPYRTGLLLFGQNFRVHIDYHYGCCAVG